MVAADALEGDRSEEGLPSESFVGWTAVSLLMSLAGIPLSGAVEVVSPSSVDLSG
tara:strand:+ start:4614 stop:4778 length:165 start_codon:yes stop_codon:yes gene_type:complete